MRRIYENPPVEEVVCEFIFDKSSPWDFTIPGVLYERLKGRFPKKGTGQNIETQFRGSERGLEEVTSHAIDVAVLHREDEKAIVSLRPNRLTISHLSPYTSWEQFEPDLRSVLDAYQEVASPIQLERIGLRYLNRVNFEQPSVDLADYFNLYPYIGEELPQNYGPFMQTIHYVFDEGKNLMRVQLKTAPSGDPNTLSIVLDIDYFTHPLNQVGYNDISFWLLDAHKRENDVFEGCIKDTLRERFGVLQEEGDNGRS